MSRSGHHQSGLPLPVRPVSLGIPAHPKVIRRCGPRPLPLAPSSARRWPNPLVPPRGGAESDRNRQLVNVGTPTPLGPSSGAASSRRSAASASGSTRPRRLRRLAASPQLKECRSAASPCQGVVPTPFLGSPAAPGPSAPASPGSPLTGPAPRSVAGPGRRLPPFASRPQGSRSLGPTPHPVKDARRPARPRCPPATAPLQPSRRLAA